MPHDGPHDAGWLTARPEQLAFAVGGEGEVLLRLDVPHEEIGLVAGIELRLTPDEARRIAEMLVGKAQEAEAS